MGSKFEISRRNLLAASATIPLMGFGAKGLSRGSSIGTGASRSGEVQIEYVDARIMQSGASESNEFENWTAAKNYFQANADLVKQADGTQRCRLWYEYSTTPYTDSFLPVINPNTNFRWSLQVQGETGGPATAINTTYFGDDVTSEFNWALPGGVESPIGAGDLTVTLNGTKLKFGRDYMFLYDSYTPGDSSFPSLTGKIRLITWTPGTPATRQPRPLATGETLVLTSVEARPVLQSSASLKPITLKNPSANPEQTDPPIYTQFYGVEDLVITTTDVYKKDIDIIAENARIKGCFVFKCGRNGIQDTAPSEFNNPSLESRPTQFDILDTTLFDNCDFGGLVHNIYQGPYGICIYDNFVSTDPGIAFSNFSGHCLKNKARQQFWLTNSMLGQRTIADEMGLTGTGTTASALSLVTYTQVIVMEDNFFHHRDNGRFVTITTRRTDQEWGVGSHGWQRAVFQLTPLGTNFAAPLNRTTYLNPGLEWTLNATGGQTVFTFQRHPQFTGYWEVTSGDELVASVWPNQQGIMPVLLDSNQFSASITNGEGTIDVSGGASPAYPSGVPAGSEVFVSCHHKRDIADFFTPGFFNQFKTCAVFASGFASGSTTSVAWSQNALPDYGRKDAPQAADFHVSRNGTTGTLGVDYTITGAGTTSGTVEFTPPLADGDFYVITTDGHKTQGVAAVNLESQHSIQYNAAFPGDPITPWSLDAGYRWPTAYRNFIRNCTFAKDSTSGSDQYVLIVDGTQPHRDEDTQTRRFMGVPTEWPELCHGYAAGNSTWNVPNGWQDLTANHQYGLTVGTPQNGGSTYLTIDGVEQNPSPSEGQLPSWWLTKAKRPPFIRV